MAKRVAEKLPFKRATEHELLMSGRLGHRFQDGEKCKVTLWPDAPIRLIRQSVLLAVDAFLDKADKYAIDPLTDAAAPVLVETFNKAWDGIEVFIVVGRTYDDPDYEPPAFEEDGMLAQDARLALALDRIGQEGKVLAGHVRENARTRWAGQKDITNRELYKLWHNPEGQEDDGALSAPWIGLVIQALWLDVVRQKLQRERAKPPALVCQVHEDVAAIHSRSFKQEESNGQRLLRLVDGSSAELIQPDSTLPSFELGVLNTLIDRGLDLLGSVTAHKLLRWEVWEGHAQHMQKKPKANTIEVMGGWSGIAHELGLKTKKSADDVHAVIAAQAHCRFVLPDGTYGNMLSYLVTPARGQRQSCVSLSLGAMLMPDYLFELRARMGEGRALREAQRLVPVVECPPFVGRANDHGQQATLSMSVVREMRARACEMVEQGGVLIPLDRFADLARESALPARLIGAVIDRWTQDGDDGPAFLERVEQDRYTLGKAHSVAKTFIEEAGRIELVASARGKQSVTNKKHQITRGNKSKTSRGK